MTRSPWIALKINIPMKAQADDYYQNQFVHENSSTLANRFFSCSCTLTIFNITSHKTSSLLIFLDIYSQAVPAAEDSCLLLPLNSSKSRFSAAQSLLVSTEGCDFLQQHCYQPGQDKKKFFPSIATELLLHYHQTGIMAHAKI